MKTIWVAQAIHQSGRYIQFPTGERTNMEFFTGAVGFAKKFRDENAAAHYCDGWNHSLMREQNPAADPIAPVEVVI